MPTKFQYEQKVKDIVTHYRGKVTAFVFYFDKRPAQYLVESVDSTGRPIEEWVDEFRLVND